MTAPAGRHVKAQRGSDGEEQSHLREDRLRALQTLQIPLTQRSEPGHQATTKDIHGALGRSLEAWRERRPRIMSPRNAVHGQKTTTPSCFSLALSSL